MSAPAGVSADELVQALARRGATLPAEIATFIVLEGCELMLSGGPRELAGPSNVRISEQGGIALSGAASDDEPGARSLHRVLASLLASAGPRLPPALSRLLTAGPQSGTFSLRTLHDELEAALVPLNRNASRRVLARFAREAIHPPLHPDEVDAALDSLLGVGGPPANDAPGKASHVRSRGLASERDLGPERDSGLDMEHEPAEAAHVPASVPPPARSPSIRPSFAPHEPGRDSLPALGERLEEADPDAPTRSRKVFFGFALAALGIAAVAVALSIRSGRAPSAAVERPRAAELAPEGGDLLVRVSEPNAQVLRFVGRAPVNVERLPVGVAHEFAATAEGHRPSRVLVPATADWEQTAEGARYEVALQLEPAERDAGAEVLELGASRLSSPPAGAPTRLGTVRVVATPRGARVYQLVGFSPEVQLHDVPLAAAQELLIYRQGFVPVVRVVSPDDFKSAGDRRVAELNVVLATR